jgi:membrane-associated protease RseP (regulator of RpoE activity)
MEFLHNRYIISIGGLLCVILYVRLSSIVYTIVHELAHYAEARLAGVEIVSFTIGSPIRTWIDRGGTKWGVGIPTGGNVAMLHEYTKCAEVPSQERSGAFPCKTSKERFKIIAAGPLSSIFLPIIIIVIFYIMSNSQEFFASLTKFFELISVFWAGLKGDPRPLPLAWAVFSLPAGSLIWVGGLWSMIAGVANLVPLGRLDGKVLMDIMASGSDRPYLIRSAYWATTILVLAYPTVLIFKFLWNYEVFPLLKILVRI